jgi:hypothetical protein
MIVTIKLLCLWCDCGDGYDDCNYYDKYDIVQKIPGLVLSVATNSKWQTSQSGWEVSSLWGWEERRDRQTDRMCP